jgi:hypothetical protein
MNFKFDADLPPDPDPPFDFLCISGSVFGSVFHSVPYPDPASLWFGSGSGVHAHSPLNVGREGLAGEAHILLPNSHRLNIETRELHNKMRLNSLQKDIFTAWKFAFKLTEKKLAGGGGDLLNLDAKSSMAWKFHGGIRFLAQKARWVLWNAWRHEKIWV